MKKDNISSDMANVIGIYIEMINQILKEREEQNDN